MSKADEAADLLAETARWGGTIDSLPPALRPHVPTEAMAIQAAFIRRHGSCGWKVGPHPSGAGWAGAPLRGKAASLTPHRLSAADAATMRIEVEVAVMLGDDLLAGASLADVRAAIAGTYIAFELFRSSYADPGQQDFPSLLADNLSNSGVVLGKGTLSQGTDFAALHIKMERDAEVQATAEKGATLDAIVGGIHWLAGYAAELGSVLRCGQVILTGARIGPLSVATPGTYRASCPTSDVVLHVGSMSTSIL